MCSTSTKIDPDLAANIYHSCYKGGFLNLNRNKTTFPKNFMYFGLFPITINLLGNYTDFKNYSHRLNKLLINRVTEKKEIRAFIFLYSKSLCIICLLFFMGNIKKTHVITYVLFYWLDISVHAWIILSKNPSHKKGNKNHFNSILIEW